MLQMSKPFTSCSLLLRKPGRPLTRENGTMELFTTQSRRERELYVSMADSDGFVLFEPRLTHGNHVM